MKHTNWEEEFKEKFIEFLLCYEVIETNEKDFSELRKYSLPITENPTKEKYILAPYCYEMIRFIATQIEEAYKRGQEDEAIARSKEEIETYELVSSIKTKLNRMENQIDDVLLQTRQPNKE